MGEWRGDEEESDLGRCCVSYDRDEIRDLIRRAKAEGRRQGLEEALGRCRELSVHAEQTYGIKERVGVDMCIRALKVSDE